MKTYIVTAHRRRDDGIHCSVHHFRSRRPLWQEEIEAECIMDALISAYQKWGDMEEFVYSEAMAESGYGELCLEATLMFINIKES